VILRLTSLPATSQTRRSRAYERLHLRGKMRLNKTGAGAGVIGLIPAVLSSGAGRRAPLPRWRWGSSLTQEWVTGALQGTDAIRTSLLLKRRTRVGNEVSVSRAALTERLHSDSNRLIVIPLSPVLATHGYSRRPSRRNHG
jgi:hypothetical protein